MGVLFCPYGGCSAWKTVNVNLQNQVAVTSIYLKKVLPPECRVLLHRSDGILFIFTLNRRACLSKIFESWMEWRERFGGKPIGLQHECVRFGGNDDWRMGTNGASANSPRCRHRLARLATPCAPSVTADAVRHRQIYGWCSKLLVACGGAVHSSAGRGLKRVVSVTVQRIRSWSLVGKEIWKPFFTFCKKCVLCICCSPWHIEV
jgi:hypothetical protein